MAQAQRQSNLFAAEDFRTIYRTFNQINFTAYDFDTIKQAMVEYLQDNFPEDFNDFIESSEFIAIVELLAYMGQTIAFRQDLNVRENFLDTAERQESILRLANMLNYTPKRNIPGTGMLKFHSIRTTEEIFDSNGTNLTNRSIVWNDPNNTAFLEQFILILNQAFITQNPFGTPVKKGTLNNIPTEVYHVDVVDNFKVVHPLSATVNGRSYPFEIVNAIFDDQLYVKEVAPNPTDNFGILYLNDGLGNGSANTGFFGYAKQGTLAYQDFDVATPLPNRELDIDVPGINEFDVWVQTINSTGQVLHNWEKVPAISGTNVVYNNIIEGTRKIFKVNSHANDTISVRFSDGNFGDIPYGIIRVWYRSSANSNAVIKSEDVGLQTIRLSYVDATGATQVLSIVLQLVTNIGNSLESEPISVIKENASRTFYTQDRMITGEDYNIYPMFKNSGILKMKAINRTHSGHSRNIDINDPTGTVQNLNVFADDGMLYKDEQNAELTFSLTASLTSNSIIQRYLQPQLSLDELTNFYYDTYRKEIQRIDGVSAWKLTTTEQLQWVTLPQAKLHNKGYFVLNETTFSFSNSMAIGSIASGKRAYLIEKCLLEFTDSTGTITEYATIENVINNGDPFGRTAGPIELNKEIPHGYILTKFFPTFRRIFNQVEKVGITAQLDLKNTFGIGFDYKSSSLYVISPNNLELTSTAYSQAFAQDNTSDNKDASWIIKAEYQAATSATDATYLITTRGLRYIFESEEDVRFYFNNAYKTIDIKTGQAKKDLVALLKVNIDKRAQIDNVALTNPGSGYQAAPVVTFSASGEVEEATAISSLSWNVIEGGLGGVGYVPANNALTYLDSNVVDSSGNQTEISINNNGVLASNGRSIQLKANLSTNATATIILANDAVGAITVTAGGTLYILSPTVNISAPGGSGTQATATAIISQALTGFTFGSPGYHGGGYQNIPSVYIDPPGYIGSTWTVNHNLNQQYVNFEIIDANHQVMSTVYNAPTVTYTDANSLTIAWNTATTGYVNIIKSRYGFNTLIPASNIWIIEHNLIGTDGIVNIDIVDSANVSLQGKENYPMIEYTSETQCRVIFPIGVTQSGYALVHNSAGNDGAVGNGYLHTQTSSATTWTVSHNLGMKHCHVDIAVLGAMFESGADYTATISPTLYYNIKGLYDYPTITYVDENTLTIQFLTATAGKAIITHGELHGSQVQAVGTPHMEVGDDITVPSDCPPVIINSRGTGFVSGDVGKVYTVIGGTGTSATVTIASVSAGAVTGLYGGHRSMDTFGAADALRTAGTYTGVTGSTSGTGVVGTFDITVDGTGAVTSVTVVTRGDNNHKVDDTITIADANLGGGGAADFTMDVASTSGFTTGGDYTVLPTVISCITTGATGSVGIGLTLDLNFKVKSVVLSPAGEGYQTTPTITIGAPAGTCGTKTTATGAPSLIGEVIAVNVDNPGSGYSSNPVISFTGGGGNGATATATLSNSVVDTTITNSGTSYTPGTPPETDPAPVAITFPAPSSPPSGVTPVTATGEVYVNSAGNISAINITQGGTGYTAADNAADITIEPSGVIRSLEITDTGYGYTGQPFFTYPTTTGGAGASQIMVKGFVSRVQITDAGSGYSATDVVTFGNPPSPGLTATGTISIRSTKNFTNDIKFNMSNLLTYEDGYRDPKKALITFYDSDNDMVPDDPLSFDRFVNTNRHIFQETYTEFDGYVYYKLTKNVLEAVNQTEENIILSNGADYAGKYIYRSDTKEFKKISTTSPYTATLLVNDTDGTIKFKAYVGRSTHITPTITSSAIIDNPAEDVFFQWKHYAPIDQRVDPSPTNLIDIFVLTRSYYTNVLSWKANNSSIGEFPIEPTTAELAVSMDTLSTYKSISDEIIYKPVKFKLLFGADAQSSLQATFKIIKVIGSTLSDNELRSRVVSVTNDFFSIDNWDLGESFYYTELAAYIHQNLSSHLSSIVIVPTQAESNFGNLFQVKAEPDELFLSVANVNNVEVVKGYTEQNLKIR